MKLRIRKSIKCKSVLPLPTHSIRFSYFHLAWGIIDVSMPSIVKIYFVIVLLNCMPWDALSQYKYTSHEATSFYKFMRLYVTYPNII